MTNHDSGESATRPVGTRSVVTSILIDAFRRAVDEGRDRLTYEELSELVGQDVRQFRANISAARNVMERDYGRRWQTVPKIGFHLANDAMVLGEARYDRRRIERQAKRTIRRNGRCIRVENLTRDEQATFYIENAVLATLAHAAREKTVRQVTDRVGPNPAHLALEDTLSAMRNQA